MKRLGAGPRGGPEGLEQGIDGAEADIYLWARQIQESNAQLHAKLLHDVARTNRELEAFCYSIFQDLRAPLRSIDGFSQMLLEDYHAALDHKGQHYLRRVRSAAQRMGQLIEDLLQLSREERASLKPELTDLSALARQVAERLHRSESDRQVHFDIQDGLSANVDARLFEIVLESLLGNAYKFTRHEPESKIEVGVTGEGSRKTFFVRDNGVGFDAAYAGKLFAPFQRLHTEAEYPGRGIGLAMVKRIISRHGGEVWADGRVGQGATFSWTLAPQSG